MTILTIEIDKERDLPALHAILERLGLKYEIEESDINTLPKEAINGIKKGLADIKAGRVYTHEEAMHRISDKLAKLKAGVDS